MLGAKVLAAGLRGLIDFTIQFSQSTHDALLGQICSLPICQSAALLTMRAQKKKYRYSWFIDATCNMPMHCSSACRICVCECGWITVCCLILFCFAVFAVLFARRWERVVVAFVICFANWICVYLNNCQAYVNQYEVIVYFIYTCKSQ